jgi:hypothetical protein
MAISKILILKISHGEPHEKTPQIEIGTDALPAETGIVDAH